MNPRLFLAACLALMLASGAPPAQAQATTQDDVLAAELRPGWRTADGTYMAALRLTLEPGWKTYWRSPGDAGIAPEFNWSGSQNLAGVRLHWPRPHVFHLNGMQSIGYSRELVLPVELTPLDPSRPIALRGEVDLGICEDICMPADLSFQAEFSGPGAPDKAIRAALNDRPATGAEAGLGRIGCAVEPISDGLRVTAHLSLPPTGGQETVVIEPGPSPVWVSESVVSRSGQQLAATADFVSDTGGPVMLNRSAIVVTVLGQNRVVEITGCPAP